MTPKTNDVGERLASLETSIANIAENMKRIEGATEKLLTVIEKRENHILREVDQLEQQIREMRNTVNELEKKLAYWQGIVAVIAFIWPAILKWLL